MTTMTPKQAADAIGTDPRTLRKYLRDSIPREDHPGKGGRWELKGSKRDLAALRKGFLAWQAEQAKEAQERAAKAAKDAQDALDADADSDSDADAGDEDSTETLDD